MQIIFVSIAYCEPGRPSTGLPNYLRRVSYALTNMGHQVTVLYSAGYNQIRYDENVEVIAVKIPHFIESDKLKETRNSCLINSYYLNKKLEEIIEQRSIDIIQFTSLKGIGILYKGRIPAVMRLSSYAKTAYVSEMTITKESSDVYAFFERNAANAMDAIFAPCTITADAYGSDIGREVTVIESPYEDDIVELDEGFYEKNIHGKKYCLFFGVMIAEKGIMVISQILEEFLDLFSDYYFIAIGESYILQGRSASDILLDAAGRHRDRVRIYPALSHSTLYPVISHADFVVLPSLMENLSNACIEAMHFKRVVVGTDGASYEQLINDNENGFLCTIGDAHSLLEKMSQAARLNSKERKEMGERAYQRIEKMRPEKTVVSLIDYYKTVIRTKMEKDKKQRHECALYEEVDMLLKEHRDDVVQQTMEISDKRYLQNRLLVHWMKKKIDGSNCMEFFESNNFKKVAVYGVYDLGDLLIRELISNGICEVYGIDRKYRESIVPVFSPDDEIPYADVMVVTAISYFCDIKENMSLAFPNRIVSIEDVVFV